MAPPSPKATLYELLDGEGCGPERAIHATNYMGVSIIPNIGDSAALEMALAADEARRYTLLRDRLRTYSKSRFDYTLLDCPPNLGVFTWQAMAASDFVLCPISGGSIFAMAGLEKTLETIRFVQETVNPDLKFLRLLINLIDRRESVDKALEANVREEHAGRVFNTIIPRCTAVKQAEALQQTIQRAMPKCVAATKFRTLALELIELVEGSEAGGHG
jgi:cellulose biosynthesis protein BcsQ